MDLIGVEFHGKPILIEEARSQATQSLKCDPKLRNTQDPQNLLPPKRAQRNLIPIPLRQKKKKKSCFSAIGSLKI